jgi:hypothetical protein
MFVICGTARVVIKNAYFNQWQNITFKFTVFGSGLCYFMIGIYIMFYDYKVTRGLSPATDTAWKDFTLLFVFGDLALYKEICNLHNRFDRTDKLKYSYKLVD